HGRYLEYRYRFRWDGTDDTCGMNSQRVPALAAGCCLCLSRGVDEGYDPPVRQTSCEEARARCDGAVRSEGMIPPLRYFLPEDRAPEVESALRTRAAAIELAIGPDGTPAVRELLLDRRPWRDVLER
ncbi:MAG TPA: hypothetical protein VEL05_12450, partial [Candidatus Acidoferrum sp.]|nr:hypothetical protein [Candidatus Acidoferrum sp.]